MQWWQASSSGYKCLYHWKLKKVHRHWPLGLIQHSSGCIWNLIYWRMRSHPIWSKKWRKKKSCFCFFGILVFASLQAPRGESSPCQHRSFSIQIGAERRQFSALCYVLWISQLPVFRRLFCMWNADLPCKLIIYFINI